MTLTHAAYHHMWKELSEEVTLHGLKCEVALTDLHLAQRERLRYRLYLGDAGPYVKGLRHHANQMVAGARHTVLVHYRHFLRAKRALQALEAQYYQDVLKPEREEIRREWN